MNIIYVSLFMGRIRHCFNGIWCHQNEGECWGGSCTCGRTHTHVSTAGVCAARRYSGASNAASQAVLTLVTRGRFLDVGVKIYH